jgi:hypothetical protein
MEATKLCDLFLAQQIRQALFQKQLEIIKRFEKDADSLSEELKRCEVALP